MKLLANIVLVVTTVALLAGGVVLIVRSSGGGGMEIVLPTPEAQPAAPAAEIKVYVTGAVASPGVYAVEAGSRLEQVVAAAGGLTGDADPEAVNLAVRVEDEQHWHVPRAGESARPPTSGAPTASSKIDLNSATARELETLPGIGAVRAQSIIDYRQANGPFSSVDDLIAVSGIGPATVESVRDLVDAR